MPGLTEAQCKYIREKVSNDINRLLSLQSCPPTQSPSPTTSPSDSLLYTEATIPFPASRESSQILFNAASSGLPPTLPMSPRQHHSESSQPAFRMKSMWKRGSRSSHGSHGSHGSHSSRRLSAGVASLRSADYQEIDGQKGGDENVVMLNLGLGFEEEKPLGIGLDAPVSSGKSVEKGTEV